MGEEIFFLLQGRKKGKERGTLANGGPQASPHLKVGRSDHSHTHHRGAGTAENPAAQGVWRLLLASAPGFLPPGGRGWGLGVCVSGGWGAGFFMVLEL